MPTKNGSQRMMRTKTLALALSSTLGLMALACGGGDDGGPSADDERILVETFSDLARFTAIRLDTAALARALRAGQSIRLPFGRAGGGTEERELELTLRNLRAPELTGFVLKDGRAGRGSSMPLPPPATYQGIVRNRGTAVFTINERVVEGSMLVAPGGWSFIEPLEPQLRLRGVDPAVRQRLLRKYDHIVFNTQDVLDRLAPNDGLVGSARPARQPVKPSPLVMSIVADGDARLFAAYPLDSVMPFWLKQETLLNAVDWEYNCVEPEANAENAYADCDNEFDGGSNAFQARVRIDRLEVWTTGGPGATNREELLQQSISMTHQSSPLCCGEPHTAGRSSLVHFFAGIDFAGGAGLAAGVGGINEYGPTCLVPNGECHHALSQVVPGRFRGTTFHQQSLVAHEIGHNADAPEILSAEPVKWLFGEQTGSSLMYSSQSGFSSSSLYIYLAQDAKTRMGPRLAERLGKMGDSP